MRSSSFLQSATPLLIVGALAVTGLTACSSPGQKSSSGTDTNKTSEIVLADGSDLGSYNPVNGYGELGVSPMYEGLVGLESKDPEKLPELRPVLAAQLPEPNQDFTTWTVKLRPGVKFHDGTDFGADDVVATYREVLNPNVASEIADSFAMIQQVEPEKTPEGGEAVKFTLKYPYPDFPSRLLLGIAPQEKMQGKVATESSLNTEPIGTGAYQLESLSADKAVWKAFDQYWGEKPQVQKITLVHVPDDSQRVSRTAAGEFDGAQIPPALAATFNGKNDYEILKAYSADWRGVSFPASSVFTKDPQVRVALNMAIDRDTIIEKVLAGSGTPAYTPVSAVYSAFDGNAKFAYDVEEAKKILDRAGWVPGPDGVRAKDGEKAAFTLSYSASDTVRRDLSAAFADAMKKIGVAVTLEGTTWEKLEDVREQRAVMLGGGDKPYSIDTQVYATLHQNLTGGSMWDNPSNIGSAQMDSLLDQARKTGDQATRDQLYQQIQQQYLENPNYVFIAFLKHNYVMKKTGLDHGNLVVEPHAHGVSWGPWWNLAAWK